MKFLQALSGLRSAIMAVVLLAEVVSRGMGYDAGPVFSVVRTAFSALGWDASPGNLLFDPATTGAAIVTLYVVAMRVKAWWAARHAEKPTFR